MSIPSQSMTADEKRGFFVGLRTKLMSALVALFILAFVAIFIWMDKFVTELAMRNLQTDLVATAKTAAAGIDGDAHAALFDHGAIDDATYTEIADFLRSVQKTNPQASGVYTYVQLPDETDRVKLVVSSGYPPGVTPPPVDAETHSDSCKASTLPRPEMREDYFDISPTMVAGIQHAGAETELWTDDWGTWLSGYAPIYNSKGESVGAVGVDMCASDVIALQENIRRNVLIVLAISLAALIVVVWVIATGVTRPVQALTRVADRIGSGDYAQDFSSLHSARIQDEVDKLASVFEMMVGKVYTREQNLRARVQQLEIMIDQSKREREVQQIVESDFFQDLQGKVNEMRSRFKKEE
jgi:HAMP domain-containing protein